MRHLIFIDYFGVGEPSDGLPGIAKYHKILTRRSSKVDVYFMPNVDSLAANQ